jgi:hypothetical protein
MEPSPEDPKATVPDVSNSTGVPSSLNAGIPFSTENAFNGDQSNRAAHDGDDVDGFRQTNMHAALDTAENESKRHTKEVFSNSNLVATSNNNNDLSLQIGSDAFASHIVQNQNGE